MVTLVDLRAYWRFLKVTRQFLPLVIAYARDRRRFLLFGGRRQVSPERQRKRAQRLLDSLLTLGPTFIKLGQLLSTRPDVLPPAYIDVLARLQDDVPPAEWEEARQVLEAELGPVDERFDDFDRTPISGASLGQVYVGTYRDQQVAVKVRRPGVEDLVEADLQAIRWTLPILLYFVDENRAFSMRNLADEFAKTIREEMDYRREARMLQEIRANFTDNDRVVIPGVVEEVSTDRVLTMEYIGGTKITRVSELDRRGIDRSEVAETLQRAYMQMMVEDGVFHADPHPGNLAVADDGRIIFYDFGMSGRVDPFIQDSIVDFYTAVASRDIDAILDTLIAMGTLSPEADRGVISEVMEVAIQDARGQDVDQYRVQQIVNQVEDTIYEFPLRMPRDLALVLRVATVVEGVCVTLDEDFDFIEVATGYLREQGYFEETVRNTVREYGQDVRDAAGSLLRTPPKLERTLDRIDRGNFDVNANLKDPNDLLDRLAVRLTYALLVAFGGLSTTILYVAPGRPDAWLVAAGITALLGIQLYRKLRGPKGIRAKPQFTRQNLRERQESEGATLATEVEPDPQDDRERAAEATPAGESGTDGSPAGAGGESRSVPVSDRRAREGSGVSGRAARPDEGTEPVSGETERPDGVEGSPGDRVARDRGDRRPHDGSRDDGRATGSRTDGQDGDRDDVSIDGDGNDRDNSSDVGGDDDHGGSPDDGNGGGFDGDTSNGDRR